MDLMTDVHHQTLEGAKGQQLKTLLTLEEGEQRQVAYLLAADKYFRLLLIRLDGSTQPVSLTQNGFSKPRPRLLACI